MILYFNNSKDKYSREVMNLHYTEQENRSDKHTSLLIVSK